MVNYTSPAKTAISDTRPAESDGKVWVDTSQDPPKMKLYDAATQAFIPASAKSTIVSQTKPTPERGKIWFEPAQNGTNMYAASSDLWEFLKFLPEIPDSVVLNVTASDYDPANNKYVANIGPDVPDAGGDPTKTTDTVAGSSGVDVVDYDGSDDYSQTTQISSTNDVIAIVWTGKVKTTNNNDFYVDGGSLLELSMNDDDTADGWRLFRGGSNFAVSNSGSVKTDYVTYSLIGRNGNEVGLKINNNLVAGFATGQSFQQLTGATIGGRADGSVAGSKFIEYSVIDSGTIADVDAEASRQGSKYGTF